MSIRDDVNERKSKLSKINNISLYNYLQRKNIEKLATA